MPEEKEDFREIAMLLNKYKGVDVTELMDDVNEKVHVILLKIFDMDYDELHEGPLIEFLYKFSNDLIKKLSYVKNNIDITKSEV